MKPETPKFYVFSVVFPRATIVDFSLTSLQLRFCYMATIKSLAVRHHCAILISFELLNHPDIVKN